MAEGEKQLSLRERNKLRTRREIHAAALEVFQEEGFAGSSVDKIAKTAGTSKGTIYVYFPDGLNDIYREIYADLSKKILNAGCNARDAESDPVKRIMALAAALLELCAQPETGRFYSLLSPTLRPVLAPVLGQASSEFTVMVAEDVQALRNKDSAADATVFAELLVGAMREAAKIVSDAPRKKKSLLAGLEALAAGLARSPDRTA
ncbi:TetR/AcrR family transcriptional regulator [Leisingera sp. McT4-56]|uniref:TetR/AcrR family transcriptional regulator n=1 Tax=Leisingera sp. McT4-56 TaxID=2881255 RepID=UPI001CF846EA|nr:TetR/AcrR family transcriptional regulator [Leisingera sp. McT4-56]MCB4458002.1 TetR/AcrR family transcriptional regulator [Leisingera sp. McT4-56]